MTGPWSDLPPPEPKRPLRPLRQRFAGREPIIRNWRGLLVVVFLVFVAPLLASWAAHLIMASVAGR